MAQAICCKCVMWKGWWEVCQDLTHRPSPKRLQPRRSGWVGLASPPHIHAALLPTPAEHHPASFNPCLQQHSVSNCYLFFMRAWGLLAFHHSGPCSDFFLCGLMPFLCGLLTFKVVSVCIRHPAVQDFNYVRSNWDGNPHWNPNLGLPFYCVAAISSSNWQLVHSNDWFPWFQCTTTCSVDS